MSDFDLDDWLSEDGSVETTTAVEKPVLTKNEVAILNYCEQVFWETGMLPTPEACSESLSIAVTTCRNAFLSDTFRNQIAARGMDPEQLITVGKLIKESKALSPKQIICANLMLNLYDKRSIREKLAGIQVSPQQFAAWQRQPQFVEFMRKRGEALFSSSDWAAYRSLIRNVEAGDNKSLELFFRMRKIYDPTVNINLNIDAVLTQVIEVVSRHVSPQVMNAIAAELDAVIEAESA